MIVMQFSLKCKHDLFFFKAAETKITLKDLVSIKKTHQTMYVSITKQIPCLLNWGFCGDSLKLIDLITFDRFGSSNKMSDRKHRALHNCNYFQYLCQLLYIVYCVADVSVLLLFLHF